MTDPQVPEAVRRLSRKRIVSAAIELLDANGESGLTFRSLALKLETGHGAIQWHLANKAELLAAATDEVLTQALTAEGSTPEPREAVHAVALGVFTAIDEHPWLGAQLFAAPWQPGMIRLWEELGGAIQQLGVPEPMLFTAASTLVSYIVGVGRQNAVNTHTLAARNGRDAVVGSVATLWENLDPHEHPFMRRIAPQLRAHDDHREFLGGLDIILDGLTVQQPAARAPLNLT